MKTLQVGTGTFAISFLKAIFALLLLMVGENVAQTSNMNLSNLASFDGEPSIAVNPTNPDNIIAGWMRFRLDSRLWIATRASFDGGRTWSNIQFQPHAFSDYHSADVSIVFHRTGRAYLSFVDFKTSPDTTGAVFLTSSGDGGLSWEAPKQVIEMSDRPGLPVDRPWVAIDNSEGPNDGTVYVTSMSAFWYPGQHHLYLRSTSDGGDRWSPIRQIDDTAFSVGSIPISYGAVSVGGDGRLYVAYISFDTSVSPFLRYYVATSADAGATFQRYVIRNVFLTASPAYFKGWSVAADPIRDGHAVLCWIDQRFGDLDVVLSKTTDGGQTWSAPVRINDDAVANGAAQDEVWTAFSRTGNLGVVWRDRRLSGAGVEVPFDIYAVVSEDGGTTFSPNLRLSTVSSPYSPVNCCNSFLGVAVSDDFIDADWGDFRNGDWDIYHSRVALSVLVSVEGPEPVQPLNFSLSQNYPNPFNPETTIHYQLPKTGKVTLKIYNLLGEEVRALVNENQPAGSYSVVWDGKNDAGELVTSGVYFYKLKIGESVTATRKMLFLQ